jgi:carbonic anhydrase
MSMGGRRMPYHTEQPQLSSTNNLATTARGNHTGQDALASIYPGKNDRNPYVERNIPFRRAFQADIEELRPTFEKREPHTLWICCSDSRVPPELIVGAKPGELFVHSNIGNMMPPPDNDDACTTAVLIYALEHLPSVRNIVICGHTGCGAMAALVDFTYGDLEPELARWLAQAEPILDSVLDEVDTPDFEQALAEANVALQIKRLSQYQAVIDRVQTGSLTIYGLMYDVTSGLLSESSRLRTCYPEPSSISPQTTHHPVMSSLQSYSCDKFASRMRRCSND